MKRSMATRTLFLALVAACVAAIAVSTIQIVLAGRGIERERATRCLEEWPARRSLPG